MSELSPSDKHGETTVTSREAAVELAAQSGIFALKSMALGYAKQLAELESQSSTAAPKHPMDHPAPAYCSMEDTTARFKEACAASATRAPSELGWLIEMPAARFGTGYCWKGVTQYGTWGSIEEAVRFARKEDAERVIEGLHAEDKRRYGYTQDKKYEACEHMWPVMAPTDGRTAT